nr:MAG TPA: hypothetical protein [Caudoviricetes sp.]
MNYLVKHDHRHSANACCNAHVDGNKKPSGDGCKSIEQCRSTIKS